jgi:membrane-associated protease RseP (regulator of RpoE activity)
MRKRRIVWATCRIALLSLAMAGAVAGRAAAQSNGTPWLGVTTQQITDELRDGLDYQGAGVIVNRVINDSPADRAGVRKGDVIVNFNSRVIDSPDELSDVVRSARVGQTISLTVMRDGSRRTLSARLAEWRVGNDALHRRWQTAHASPSMPVFMMPSGSKARRMPSTSASEERGRESTPQSEAGIRSPTTV